jgi:methyl-accepting chemotaxis protein
MDLSRTKVSTRLAGGFMSVVALLVVTAGITLYELSQIRERMDYIVQVSQVKIRLNNEMNDAIHEVVRVMRTVLLLQDEAARNAERPKIAAARERYNKASTELDAMPTYAEERALRDRIKQTIATVRPLNDRVTELGNAGQVAEATELLMKEAGPATLVWQDLLDESIELGGKLADNAYQEAVNEFEVTQMTLIGSTALSILIALVAATLVSRSITRQLGGEPSEATDLARAVAAGDLTTPIRLRSGDTHSMMAQLKAMQDSLSKIVSTVRSSADEVATASSQIAQGNNDLSARTEEQASSLEQTAASMEQMRTNVSQTSDSARQANQLSQGASEVAVRGGEVVNQVVETMKGINDSSRKIADIIGVIDGIAFQTNILALNAAVEAARAGEQGRGFAVVASEVRSLAGRSAEAAKEIKNLISDSVKRVEEGTVLVDKAGATMTEIVDAIQRATDIMGEISAAAAEESTGVSQVVEAVSQIDQVTQQNAALVEESAAAASSLQQQAQQLVQTVSVFKTAEGQGALVAQRSVAPPPRKSPPPAARPPAAGKPRLASPKAAGPGPALPPAASKPPAAPGMKAVGGPSANRAKPAAAPKASDDNGDWESF